MHETHHQYLPKPVREFRSIPLVSLLSAVFTAILASPAFSTAQQVCHDLDLVHRVDGSDLLWTNVRAASSDGSLLAVLTGSDPGVHLFSLYDGDLQASWGRSGQGPGEFSNRMGVALVGTQLYVLDGAMRRLSIFDSSGSLVRAVSLMDIGMPPHYPIRLARSEPHVLLEFSVPMGNERFLIAAMFGATGNVARQDTVAVYPRTTATSLQLRAPGGPSLTLPPPYSPSPLWAPVSSGLAFWQGPGSEFEIIGLTGDTVSVASLHFDDRFEVTAEDREFWFQNEIPQEEFGQRGVYDGVREVARRTVDFPRFHPLAFELLGAPDDLVWVRRTPDGRDQIWDVVDLRGRVIGRMPLIPGRILMAITSNHLVLKAFDALGNESIEVHQCEFPSP